MEVTATIVTARQEKALVTATAIGIVTATDIMKEVATEERIDVTATGTGDPEIMKPKTYQGVRTTVVVNIDVKTT